MSRKRVYTRADDELLLAWLILSEAGFPVAVLASLSGLSAGYVYSCIAAVRQADEAAHRRFVIGIDRASGPDQTAFHRVPA